MSIEHRIGRIGLVLCTLCLTAASGLGIGQWTMAGTGKFEDLRAARTAAYLRDRPTTSDFWEAQDAGMATSSTIDPFDRGSAPTVDVAGRLPLAEPGY